MGGPKMFHIYKKGRNFLFRFVNREFLTFLFFLILSGMFWLLMDLNETYEREIKIPVQLVEIPENVLLTSDTTTYITVTVRDKGYSLLTYIYGNKVHAVKVKFKSYAQKAANAGIIPSSELQKLIYSQLFNSSRIVNTKPDKYEFFYNYGLNKRVPVKLYGQLTPGQSYYLAKVLLSPDSVDIYAGSEALDSIDFVNTERLQFSNLTDTMVRRVALQKMRGVKYVPEDVRISVYPDVLTEGEIEVPIVVVNTPEGKRLRTFPSRVTVTFTIGASLFRSIHPESFKVMADYDELTASPSKKCNIYLRYMPDGVRSARMNVNQVDYLIEEQ